MVSLSDVSLLMVSSSSCPLTFLNMSRVRLPLGSDLRDVFCIKKKYGIVIVRFRNSVQFFLLICFYYINHLGSYSLSLQDRKQFADVIFGCLPTNLTVYNDRSLLITPKYHFLQSVQPSVRNSELTTKRQSTFTCFFFVTEFIKRRSENC